MMESACRRTERDTFWLPHDEDTGETGDPLNRKWHMETSGVLLVGTMQKKTNRVFSPLIIGNWLFLGTIR